MEHPGLRAALVVAVLLAAAALFGAAEVKKVEPPTDVPGIVAQCVAHAGKLKSYTCTMEVTERVGDKLQPTEVMQARFRTAPYSVHLTWTGKVHAKRELLYVEGRNEGMMLIFLGDWPNFRGVVPLKPDSLEVFRESRHPVTCSGVHMLAARMAEQVKEPEGDKAPVVKLAGAEKLDGRETTLIERTYEDGRRKTWAVDTALWLPVRVTVHDKAGQLLESTYYSKLDTDAKLTDKEFDPEEIW